MWGFKCILLALKFLHENCATLHGNLGLHSIFVTPNGDWKLAGFELAGNMTVGSDLEHFLQYAHLLDSTFCSPERLQREALTARSPPFYVDIYSFGQCMQRAFSLMQLETPRSHNKYLTSMLHPEMKKRPTAQKLLECALFNSEDLAFIQSIGELALKEPKEFLELIAKLEPKVAGLSRAVCAHKILPNLARTLQNAINDFPQRDARENCRQSIQVSVNMLSKLAAMDKLDSSAFQHSWVPILTQLWAMSDRSVRTVMLQSLKALVPFIPDATINRGVFDNILAGFSDSNAKLRESTLMSLIYVVDKLEEVQLQERLVRAVTNLQNDSEASIRTNATIFLGKIAVKLKEPVRVRVLCGAFQKAMKDNFLHCRVAGLRTSNACVKLLDVAQTATKIIPQASILLLDKSAEVRSLALTLIDSCLELMRGHHQSLVDKARAEAGGGGVSGERMGNISGNSSSSRLYTSASADSPSGVRAGAAAAAPSSVLRATSSSNLSDDSQQTSGSGGWSSWAVLQGISKSIESATIIAPETTSATSYQQQQQQQHVTTKSGSSAPVLSKATSNIGFDDELDFDPDMHDDGNDTTNNSNTEGAEETWDSGSSAKKFKAPAGSSSLSKPWDQLDDLDLEDGDDDDYSEDQRTAPSVPLYCSSSSSSNTAAAGGIATSRLNLPTTTTAAAAAAPINKKVVGMKLAGAGGSSKSTAATKPPKVAITKLSVDKDEGWEDF
eukprot:CAMPEP_0170366082 /NCGR_PEP_ID=MMETSP0117_2-20130122/6235_1 /TAXON_ID=400756 /ORGANISM="Durinskia baltica, Strain CSIRO CS-38" /LENGTH=724 /DNA_ID=CAMNT_0010620661 /DNA_START=444 /DNA_END=2618 /DNA_ORIENTATION=-